MTDAPSEPTITVTDGDIVFAGAGGSYALTEDDVEFPPEVPD